MLAVDPPLSEAKRQYPLFQEFLPPGEIVDGDYLLRFARTAGDLDAALKLRYDVFNLELKEGLDASHETQRDEDEFDAQCHHSIVWDKTTGKIVGTYRMQTHEMARRGRGFYSAVEFDLAGLPTDVLDQAVELGRACVAKEHRNSRVLFLLWRGLAQYLAHNQKRYLFGCCSLTSQDPAEGKAVMDYLAEHGHVHPSFSVLPQPGYACGSKETVATQPATVQVPRLMKIYLMYGAKICGPPAIDRQFKTIDYLGLIDVHELDEKTFRYFFR